MKVKVTSDFYTKFINEKRGDEWSGGNIWRKGEIITVTWNLRIYLDYSPGGYYQVEKEDLLRLLPII